jgi:polysaccharide export outer membrane protein
MKLAPARFAPGIALAVSLVTVLAPGSPASAYEERATPVEQRTAVPVATVPGRDDARPPSDLFDDDSASDYRIGRQDLLEITVFDVEELSQTVRVANDGTIRMPLLGLIEVAGHTKSEVEERIAEQLADGYVQDPQVTVFIKEYESKKVAVSGAVKSPGRYEMLGQKTLLEMISEAGGLDKDLGKEIIIFRRNDAGETRQIPVNLELLVYEANPALNLTVRPGDIIYVPTVEKIGIFVTGAVKNPDRYEVPRSEPVTVLKAITLAGGTTDRAAEKKIQVIRTDDDGGRVKFDVNLRKIKRGKLEDPILQKGDIVLVPEAFF